MHTRLDDTEQSGDVVANALKLLVLGQLHRCIARIAVGAIVDDSIHVQVQIVEFRDLR